MAPSTRGALTIKEYTAAALWSGQSRDPDAAHRRLAQLLLDTARQLHEAEFISMRSINPLLPHVADPVHYRDNAGRVCAALIIAILGDPTDEVVRLRATDPETGADWMVDQVPHGRKPGMWDWRDE